MGIVIPFVEESKSVKDLIIATLASSPPLTIKKLHSQLKRKYGIGATYQAIHKAVASFVAQGVIARKHKLYSLNPNWITSLGAFVDLLKKNNARYSGLVETKKEGSTQTYTFSSFEKARDFKKELQKEFFAQAQGPSPVYVGEDRHVITPLIQSEKALTMMKLIKSSKAKVYVAIRGDSAIDKWCANYYRNCGINARTGIDCANNCDVFVINDKIVQMYMPEDIKKSLDEIYNGCKGISDFNAHTLYKKVYTKKTNIKIVVTENAELAEHIRERIKSWF